MARRTRPNRGIVLLVVLSLLVLFVVAGLTFALLAGYYQRSANAYAKFQQKGDPPRRLLDQAMYVLLRDTQDINNPLRGHSLLRDMYGEPLMQGVVAGVTSDNFLGVGGQMVQFVVRNQNLHPTNGFYNGNLVTFVTGPASNITARIVFYHNDVQNNIQTFRIMAPYGDGSTLVAPNALDRFVMNGRPFSGAGAGYTTNGSINPAQALSPNRVGLTDADLKQNYLLGGANEPYDAADYQNMYLAAVIDPATGRVIPSFHRPALINYVVSRGGDPRRSSLRAQFASTSPLYADSNRLINGPWDVDNDGDGRPDSIWIDPDMPIQTGADGKLYKPLFAYLVVDMDGRVNLNAHGHQPHLAQLLPVQTVPFADNDPSDSNRNTFTPVVLVPAPVGRGVGTQEVSLRLFFQRSFELQGVSPSDAYNLARVVINKFLYGGAPNSINPARYGMDMAADRTAQVASSQPGVTDTDVNDNSNANGFDARARILFAEEPNSFLFPTTLNDGAATYFAPAFVQSSYGSTPDLHGELAFGLNKFGNLVFDELLVADRRANSGYEIDLSRYASRGHDARATDNPFTLAEAERFYRAFDVDAALLPSRIQGLLQELSGEVNNNDYQMVLNVVNDPSFRWAFTTASYDLPVPSSFLTGSFRNQGLGIQAPSLPIVEMLRLRMLASASQTEQEQIIEAFADQRQLAKWLPPEVLRGERMDLNRPFGNGRLRQASSGPQPLPGAGVGANALSVDRPQDVADEQVWPDSQVVTSRPETAALLDFQGRRFTHHNGIDVNNDGVVDVRDQQLARQLYARHLYIMMMLFRDQQAPLNGTRRQADIARAIAQWAVNVVDFRDSDSIMTGFEYDWNPFNGWQVNGDLNDNNDDQERGVVWGCERPELLITETFAFHDRRTEDRDDEEPDEGEDAAKFNPDDPEGDDDYDQRLRPESGFFVELYNPWRENSPKPAELYADDGEGGIGIDLQRRTPSIGGEPGMPIWRLIIVRGNSHRRGLDPDDPNARPRFDPLDIERSVYFTPPGAAATRDGDVQFHPGPGLVDRVAKVRPGHYVVIGPSSRTGDQSPDGANRFSTPIGRLENWTPGPLPVNNRRIVLSPSASPTANNPQPVEVFNPQAEQVQSLTSAIVIDMPRSLSISDPVDGYGGLVPPGVVYDSALLNGEGGYKDAGGAPYVMDIPFDKQRAEATPLEWAALMAEDGTTAHFRTVYLQRIADPGRTFDVEANPYVTIDGGSVDLTAFNGVEGGDPDAKGPQKLRFATNERGEKQQRVASVERNLWRREDPNNQGDINTYSTTPGNPPGLNDSNRFAHKLRHTLGYINQSYWSGSDPAPVNGLVGVPDWRGGATPFTSLPWNNRPFVSQYELMQVPSSSPSQLTRQFRFPQPGQAQDPYSPNQNISGEFGHLLNFFESGPQANQANHFYRIFDLAHVPSRFVSASTILNPRYFAYENVSAASLIARPNQSSQAPVQAPASALLFPPFNRLSSFRDPGKININTIYDFRVWDALLNGHPSANFMQVLDSRRGYDSSGITPAQRIMQLDGRYPTRFGNPFRPYGMGAIAPPDLQREDVESTLMRPLGFDGQGRIPLMAFGQDKLGAGATTMPSYFDGQRNSVFRYDPYTRMGNLLTTRSNVYAVWITVGYFEVDYYTGELVQELGADNGQIQRNRAFYMIDRTIPVAFEPGKNHNVDRAIKVRRSIE